MHKETYKYVGVLSDGTRVMFERQRWVPDNAGLKDPWMCQTSMREITDAYAEFKDMMEN